MIARIAKPRPSALDRRDALKAKAKNWREMIALVREREGGKCRVCGGPGVDLHHIEFRSRGGKDEPQNLILVCRDCHGDIHKHVVKLAGTASALRIARWDDKAEDFVWKVRK